MLETNSRQLYARWRKSHDLRGNLKGKLGPGLVLCLDGRPPFSYQEWCNFRIAGNLAGMPLRGSCGPVTADITRQERASRISIERVRLRSSRQSGRCPDCSCANLPETWTVSRPYNTQMTHAQSLATRSILKILLAISLCAGNALAQENPPPCCGGKWQSVRPGIRSLYGCADGR